jgi:hypothetical protein
MIFSSGHYAALGRLYAEMFGQPVPEEVALAAARNGRAPDLMDALYQATKFNEPIQDWSDFLPSYLRPPGRARPSPAEPGNAPPAV